MCRILLALFVCIFFAANSTRFQKLAWQGKSTVVVDRTALTSQNTTNTSVIFLMPVLVLTKSVPFLTTKAFTLHGAHILASLGEILAKSVTLVVKLCHETWFKQAIVEAFAKFVELLPCMRGETRDDKWLKELHGKFAEAIEKGYEVASTLSTAFESGFGDAAVEFVCSKAIDALLYAFEFEKFKNWLCQGPTSAYQEARPDTRMAPYLHKSRGDPVLAAAFYLDDVAHQCRSQPASQELLKEFIWDPLEEHSVINHTERAQQNAGYLNTQKISREFCAVQDTLIVRNFPGGYNCTAYTVPCNRNIEFTVDMIESEQFDGWWSIRHAVDKQLRCVFGMSGWVARTFQSSTLVVPTSSQEKGENAVTTLVPTLAVPTETEAEREGMPTRVATTCEQEEAAVVLQEFTRSRLQTRKHTDHLSKVATTRSSARTAIDNGTAAGKTAATMAQRPQSWKIEEMQKIKSQR